MYDGKVKSIDLSPVYSNNCMEEFVKDYKSQIDYKAITHPDSYKCNLNKLSMKLGDSNKDNCRFDYFKLNKEKTEKLIAKMKQEAPRAKLTSVLNTALMICLKRTYENYKVDDIDEVNLIQSKILVNIRDKLGLANEYMGVFSVALDNQTNIENFNEENFWKMAEKVSIDLHERLKNNDDMEQIGQKGDELIDLINKNYDFSKHTSHDYVLSNLGVMKSNKSSVIRCEDFYFTFQFKNTSFAGSFFHGIISVQGALQWSLTIDEKYFSLAFLKDLKQSLIEFFENLI
jgi:hypothetical protein